MKMIDFHSEENRYSYTTRLADKGWVETIKSLIDVKGKKVLDIGCGGGIYTKAWSELGASEVVGIDFSEAMLQGAQENCIGIQNVSFKKGDALETGLDGKIADVVFERALIHHIADLHTCFGEAHRVLKTGGHYLIQDRTQENVKLPGTKEHIRGYFFEKYPALMDVELGRRPQSQTVQRLLSDVGFRSIQEITFWETRRVYQGFDELADDLRKRIGRSILHELSDVQLNELIAYIGSQIPASQRIVEKDPWTIWMAIK